MAMSAKERKQKQLEREREALRTLQDSTYSYLHTPFHEHPACDANISSVELAFEMMGVIPPSFVDDQGPADVVPDHCFETTEQKRETFQAYEGSVGRAESMVGLLLDAATELAFMINRYKRTELDARLKEIETMDLSDPADRRRALQDTVRIEKMKDALDKNVRRSFPQWEIKGI